MDKLLIFFCILVAVAMASLSFPSGAIAVLMVLLLSLGIVYLIRRYSEESEFLIRIFLIAILIRVSFGLFIYFFDLQLFFGADALLYDSLGERVVDYWRGTANINDFLTKRAVNTTDVGWGMNYLVASIYFLAGKSILIGQSFCAVVGASTVPMIYFCAEKIFQNRNVAKITAIAVAFFPSFTIWSAQLLKDGLIIFLLVCTMTMVLSLQKKFSLSAILVLIVSMFGIFSLRFYIFYMVAASVVGSFLIGLGTSGKSILKRIATVTAIGLALTYFGVLNNTVQLEKYASLEAVQRSRQNLSESESGFGEELDVSTAEGALTTIPIGFLYLMFAPFPWQISNLRQLITLPEILVWWIMIPLIISGSWYTVRNRLREAIPIIIFTVMLTLGYSVFQGNVGTAYRQRTQIQIFLFMFAGVGWALMQEKKENKQLIRQAARDRKLRQIREMKEREMIEKPTQVKLNR